jgi:CheY-like chemotaxis protein
MNIGKILLVEDDELDIISVERSLKKLNMDYDLLVAHNGKEAMNILAANSSFIPNVILLDLNMPKMNGLEFLKAIRADKTLKDVKVFIVTTSSDKNDRKATDALGVSGYIIKPLSYQGNTKNANSMESFLQFHLRKILADELHGKLNIHKPRE